MIDGTSLHDACIGMMNARMAWEIGRPAVVGSIGNRDALASVAAEVAPAACDVVELRLDLLGAGVGAVAWAHLRGMPLLMTARSEDEGGAGGIGDGLRFELLEAALPDASLVDLEVASIPKAGALIARFVETCTPWVASFHDFSKTPELGELREKALIAREAGAAVFKVAAMIQGPADVARLAGFQLEDHGIAVATMGMGDMAVVSRLMCAQCGSVLNYGYLGGDATAPGQWSALEMKSAIARLPTCRAR